MNEIEKTTIRRYTATDKEDILNLLRLNTPKYFSPTEKKDLIDYLEHHSDNYFVIESGNEVVGCGGFNFSDDESICRISWDIFHPDFQGKGLGSMLVKYRLEKIRENHNVKMIVVRTSQLVSKFYEKLGFTLKEVIQDFWADGFDLYRMELLVEEK